MGKSLRVRKTWKGWSDGRGKRKGTGRRAQSRIVKIWDFVTISSRQGFSNIYTNHGFANVRKAQKR